MVLKWINQSLGEDASKSQIRCQDVSVSPSLRGQENEKSHIKTAWSVHCVGVSTSCFQPNLMIEGRQSTLTRRK
jgi:hypothetical protein